MVELGFVNPQAEAVIFSVNMFFEERIAKITSYKDGIPAYTKLEGLKFSFAGIVRQFPDLKEKSPDEARKIALKRLKKHLAELKTEKEVALYLKEELEKTGYKLTQIIKKGFRPIKPEQYLKDG